MKILFLDIDGVVNNSGSTFAKVGPTKTQHQIDSEQSLRRIVGDEDGKLSYTSEFTIRTIDPVAVGLLNRFFREHPEVKLVLSSTHRKKFVVAGHGSEEHLYRLSIYLGALGLEKHVYGVTPVLTGFRGDEVDRWLNEHPDVEAYSILDDSRDFYDNQNLIWCDAKYGLTQDQYFGLCKDLGVEASSEDF